MYKLFKSHSNAEHKLDIVITKKEATDMMILDESNDFDYIFSKAIEYKRVLEMMEQDVTIKLRF